MALTATALHEMVGFGLQTPVNRYLLAAWVGLVWGVWRRVEERRGRGPTNGDDDAARDNQAMAEIKFDDSDADADADADSGAGAVSGEVNGEF